MNRMKSFNSQNDIQMPRYDYKIGHLILVDRNIDFVTLFCSPLTYEGLLDDSFKINAGFIEMPTSDPTKTKRVKLSNEDKVEYFCISKNAFILK